MPNFVDQILGGIFPAIALQRKLTPKKNVLLRIWLKKNKKQLEKSM